MTDADVYKCLLSVRECISHAAWWSLLFVGPAVAPPLVLLKLFPLGCVWRSSLLGLGTSFSLVGLCSLAVGSTLDPLRGLSVRFDALALSAHCTSRDLTSLQTCRLRENLSSSVVRHFWCVLHPLHWVLQTLSRNLRGLICFCPDASYGVDFGGFLSLWLLLSLPNALAELIHAVEVWVLQEAHEIPVPEFVFRGGILIVGARSEQQLAHALRWDDLEINTPQGLDEAVLDSVAVVHS